MGSTGSLVPIHSHYNMSVLELITEDENQVLLYRGKKLSTVSEMIDFKAEFRQHVSNYNAHIQEYNAHIQNYNTHISDYNTHVTTYDAHLANTVIHVTQNDKDIWNATLQNAKDYAKSLFDQVTSFTIEIVNSLPTTDIKTMTIYFLRNTDPLTDNVYDEYMYINGHWEIVGSLGIHFDRILLDYLTRADFATAMGSYYTKTEIDSIIDGYYDKGEIDTFLADYYTKTEIDNLIDNIGDTIQALHTHENKTTLDELSEDEFGNLLFNGSRVCDLSDVYNRIQNIVDNYATTASLATVATTGSYNDLDDLPTLHEHVNKSILDALTQEVIDNSHTHSNKSILDALTQDVIDNSHEHDNQNVLDKLSVDNDGDLNYDGNKITAQGGGDGQTDHSHANKSILDKFGVDENNNLTYNNEEVIDEFTDVDVTLLIDYLWPDQAEAGFVTKDSQYINTADDKVFTPKGSVGA